MVAKLMWISVSLVVFAVFDVVVLAEGASRANFVSGSVNTSQESDPLLRVLVHSPGIPGKALRFAGTHNAVYAVYKAKISEPSFVVTGLSDGDHVFELCGSRELDFPHIRVTVTNGTTSHVEARRDPLRIAGGHGRNASTTITFNSAGEAHFVPSASTAQTIFKALRSPLVLFQIVAGLFVLWFPRFLAGLDPELIFEMTGEAPPAIGDPNSVLKKLISTDSH